MTDLLKSAWPDENLNAVISPEDWRKFVDTHAQLLCLQNQIVKAPNARVYRPAQDKPEQ